MACPARLPAPAGADHHRPHARADRAPVRHSFPLRIRLLAPRGEGCRPGRRRRLAGEPDRAAAEAFSHRVRDITVFLDELGLIAPPAMPAPLTVAYHDACHLAHAQRITAPPRRLLGMIPNLTIAEVPEGELCCGSAGTYNLEQPELARQIGERKARNILSIAPQAVVTGNIGCMNQIKVHLEMLEQPLPIWHTVEVLDLAYTGG